MTRVYRATSLGWVSTAALAVAALFVSACESRADTDNVVWTMVVMPDTQGYRNANTWPVFNEMTQWIVDNKEARNIQVVLHEGDITNNNAAEEWSEAAKAMGRLNGKVPYILSTGNHDYVGGHPTLLNDYFTLSDNPLNNSPAGILTTERVAGDLQNVYSTFKAPDGRNMLIFSLEFLPTDEDLAWANGIAAQPQYENHTAVLLTHEYLEEGPTTYPYYETVPSLTGYGSKIWKNLVRKHQNFELTFNGHSLDSRDSDPYGPLTATRLTSVGDNGNTVHQMVFNSQEQPAGGNGYMRIVEFLDDGKTVQVNTYSPYLDQWLTNDRNQFQIEILSLYAGDFNDDGVVDGADYSVWYDNQGTNVILPNDPTPGVVDDSDFELWRGHYGNTKFSGDYNNDGTVNDHDYDVWLANQGTNVVLPNDPTPGMVDHRDLVIWQNHLGRSKYASYFNGYAGDFNGDGFVDQADYDLWSESVGTNTILYNDPTIGVVDESDLAMWNANAGLGFTPGDFNGNGRVDAADYSVWRDNVGTTNVMRNDPTPGMVDDSDFEFWKSHFGEGTEMVSSGQYPTNVAPWATFLGAGSAAATVPEPSTACLAIGLPLVLLAARRRPYLYAAR